MAQADPGAPAQNSDPVVRKRTRLALPASRRHIWQATLLSILVTSVLQVLAVTRGIASDSPMFYAFSYDVWSVAYLG